jgi:dTDP-4-amino-4,6-dideoxygalactose transaminase
MATVARTIDRPAIAGGLPMFERLVPIASPELSAGRNFQRRIERILTSRQLTNGAYVRELEDATARYLGVRSCVAVANCTSGLMLLWRLLGIEGEVILPSFTFHATAHSLLWNQLKPVFADCDAQTFCVDPASVRSRMSSKTAAILAVHLFGNPAAVDELEQIAARAGLPVIYDAAHAFGARVRELQVGQFGIAEVFSLSPTKLLVAAEGGLIATNDDNLAKALRAARNYGDTGTYDPESLGLNARMSELHAALALDGLGEVGARIERRNEIRAQYALRLGAVPGLSFQYVARENRSSCKDFSVVVDKERFGLSRDQLMAALEKENIGVRRYFWPPVHRQKLYRDLWDRRPLPVTDRISDNVVSLPIYSSLKDEQVSQISDAIARIHEYASRHDLQIEFTDARPR